MVSRQARGRYDEFKSTGKSTRKHYNNHINALFTDLNKEKEAVEGRDSLCLEGIFCFGIHAYLSINKKKKEIVKSEQRINNKLEIIIDF